MSEPLPIVPGRECGDCHACCVLPEIAILGKKASVPCKCLFSGGCSAYEARPDVCRGFECGWKLNDKFRFDERPDKVGILLMGLNEPQIVVAHELWKGAFDSWKGDRLLKRESKHRLLGLADFGKPATLKHLRLCGPKRIVESIDRRVSGRV